MGKTITLLCDPHDCGLRESPDSWVDAAFAFQTRPTEFPRVTRERQAELVAEYGDAVPAHHGEVSELTVVDSVRARPEEVREEVKGWSRNQLMLALVADAVHHAKTDLAIIGDIVADVLQAASDEELQGFMVKAYWRRGPRA